MTQEELNNQKWWANFKIAKQYYFEYGNLLVPRNYVINGIRLGRWVATQREKYQKGILTQDKIDALNSIKMVWSFGLKRITWDEAYKIAESYRNEYGNLLVPENRLYHDFCLGNWIQDQREDKSKNKLDERKINKLEKINMIWNIHDYVWEQKYLLAEQYYLEHGHLMAGNDNKELQNWLTTQRLNYEKNKLSNYRIEKLEKIEMIWDPTDYKWNIFYLEAKKYYYTYGNLLVKTDEKLKTWIEYQRVLYKQGKLDNYKQKLLNEIEMIWNLYKYYFLNGKMTKTALPYRRDKLKTILYETLEDLGEDYKFNDNKDIKLIQENFIKRIY